MTSCATKQGWAAVRKKKALLILHGVREGDNMSKSDNMREGNTRNGGGNAGEGSDTRGRVVMQRRVSA